MTRFLSPSSARRLATAGFLLAIVASTAAFAAPGSADPAFSNERNTEGQVIQAEPTADGKILVLGSFPNQPSTTTFRRLNADGTLDAAFAIIALPTPGNAAAFEQQPDGKIVYVGAGENGNALAAVARLNPDGSQDSTFQPGNFQQPFGSRNFFAIAIQPDGKIIVAGGFQEYNGYVRPGVTRLNADGTVDETFIPPNDNTLTFARAAAVAVQPDGKVLVAGYATINGNSVAGIVRLNADGSQDATFIPQSVDQLLSSSKTSIVVQPDGKILFAGNFNQVGGKFQSFVARLLPTGSLDQAFNPFTTAAVQAVALQGDGKILLGGGFVNVSSAPRAGLARLKADGGLDLTFDPGTGANGGFIQTIALQADGKVLAGGGFGGFGTSARDNLVRLLNDYPGTGNPPPPPVAGLTVPGTANPFLAGQPEGVTASGGNDAAPAESPLLVPGLALNPNTPLNFSVSGSVSNDPVYPPTVGPDGGAFLNHPSENGLNGITAPVNALVGVFLDDSTPEAGAAPGGISDFSDVAASGGGVGLTGLQPALFHVFFIGDGKDASGNLQQFYPPRGATRLFLGVLDGNDYFNNLGSLSVNVTKGTLDASDLRVSQDVSSPTAANGSFALIGDNIVYTFHVKNESNAPIANVTVTDIIPQYLSFVSASDGGALQGGIVTWNLGSLAPTGAGTSRDLTLVLKSSVSQGALIHASVLNAGYFVRGDFYPTQQGLDLQNVTVLQSSLDVAFASNAAGVAPGEALTYTIDLTNLTADKIKKAVLTVPLPDGVTLVSAFYVDDRGNRIASQDALAVQNGTNVIFSAPNFKANAVMHLSLTVRLPFDIDPAAPFNFGSVQLTTKTSDGFGQNKFGVAVPPVTLSGRPAAAPPQLTISKSIIDPYSLAGLFLFDPARAAKLAGAFPAFNFYKKDPATGQTVPDGQVIEAAGEAINPYIGQDDTGSSSGGAIRSVIQLNPKQPVTYVTFTLLYENNGGANADDFTIIDRVPAGFAYVPDAPAASLPGDLFPPPYALINGTRATSDTLKVSDAGRTLTFSIKNKAKPLKPGKFGYIAYQLQVLPPAQGGPSAGTVVSTSGARIASSSLAGDVLASPDGEDLLVTGPVHFGFKLFTPNNNQGDVGKPATFQLYYQNDGGKKGKDFAIKTPLPAGCTLASAQVLAGPGADNISTLPDGGVLFDIGKVKPGQSGLVQVSIIPTAAVLNTPSRVLNLVFIPLLDGATFHSSARRGPTARAAGRPALFDDPAADSPLIVYRVLDPTVPRLFIERSVPLALEYGKPFSYVITVGNLGDRPIEQANVTDVLPPGINSAFITGNSGPVVATTDASGRFVKSIPVGAIPPHSVRSVTIQLKVDPSLYAPSSVGVNVTDNGLYATSVAAPYQIKCPPASTRLLRRGETLALVGSDPLGAGLAQYGFDANAVNTVAKAVSLGSRMTTMAGADALITNNGALVVPLGTTFVPGAPVVTGSGPVLISGPAGVISNDGGSLISQDGGGLIAAGSGNAFKLSGLISQDGGGFKGGVPQTAGSLLAGLISQDGGGLVAQGAGNLLRGGGLNLISQDGGGVISNDGGSLISQDGGGLISQDGGGIFATGYSNLIGDNLAGVLSNSSGNALASGGGKLIATGGGNAISDNGSGLIGSAPNTSALVASPGGNLVVVGGGNQP